MHAWIKVYNMTLGLQPTTHHTRVRPFQAFQSTLPPPPPAPPLILHPPSPNTNSGTRLGRPCAQTKGCLHPRNRLMRRSHCSWSSLSPNMIAPARQLGSDEKREAHLDMPSNSRALPFPGASTSSLSTSSSLRLSRSFPSFAHSSGKHLARPEKYPVRLDRA